MSTIEREQDQDTRDGVELLEGGRGVRVTCRKCGEKIRLEFGELTREEATAAMARLADIPRECPGFHVELGGWRYWWRLDEALEAVYGEEG